jgi:hypothetical protein
METVPMTKLHNNPHKWVIFREAEGQSLAGDWKERKLAHSNLLTFIVAEHYDSTGSEPPEAGYRPTEYRSATSEHVAQYRKGDWVVVRTEVFVPNIPIGNEFDEIVVCYCVYDPIEPKWKSFKQDKSIASLDSFGGDREAYNKFLLSDEVDNYEIRFNANERLSDEQVAKLKDEARANLVTA